jgi:hypothetical protein
MMAIKETGVLGMGGRDNAIRFTLFGLLACLASIFPPLCHAADNSYAPPTG